MATVWVAKTHTVDPNKGVFVFSENANETFIPLQVPQLVP